MDRGTVDEYSRVPAMEKCTICGGVSLTHTHPFFFFFGFFLGLHR